MPSLVACALPPGPAFVEVLRRVWDRGDALLPIDARLPRRAIERLLATLSPAALIAADGTTTLAGARPVEVGDALVMATSGTTGEPKGVVLTHDAVAASATATTAALGIDPTRHRWLGCLPVAHVGGLGVVTKALATGTPLTILERFDVDAVLAAVDDGCTHVALVSTMLSRVDPDIFEHIILGGAAPPAAVPPNCSLTYGLTETGSGCVYDGRPLHGCDVRIVDGEIQLRGPMLLRAYRSADDEHDPLVDGWFATGDGGDFDPANGILSVFGRRGDMIITGGQNVWPDPVERILSQVRGVAEVTVVGRTDPEWGQAVTAVVVPVDPSAPPALAALREAVKAELAPYCAPQLLELVTELPRTALGKVQRARV